MNEQEKEQAWADLLSGLRESGIGNETVKKLERDSFAKSVFFQGLTIGYHQGLVWSLNNFTENLTK